MTNFHYLIRKDKCRRDKTWNVLICFSHNSERRYIATTMYVTKKQLNDKFEIKDRHIVKKCETLIGIYRKMIDGLYLEINDIPIDNIIEILKHGKKSDYIDFIAFSREWCQNHSYIKGIRNYTSAINALCKFFDRKEVPIEEITVKNIKFFEDYLRDRPRAMSLYTSTIVKLFKEAQDYYNDEDRNIYKIRHNLERYKAPRQRYTKKRGLSPETIRAIFQLPYDNIKQKGLSSRHDLAKDCFMLSFCLLGMNSADLFNAENFDGQYITYQRTKTKDRRFDRAEMVVRVPDFILPLVRKYRGENRIFNFYERFKSMADLNRSINLGLKEIGKVIGVPNLQFYAARHSMASIAVNKVSIDKYTVNDMLNHIDQSMRTTDIYIEKDFSRINMANEKLMKYMFDDIMGKIIL